MTKLYHLHLKIAKTEHQSVPVLYYCSRSNEKSRITRKTMIFFSIIEEDLSLQNIGIKIILCSYLPVYIQEKQVFVFLIILKKSSDFLLFVQQCSTFFSYRRLHYLLVLNFAEPEKKFDILIEFHW